MKIQKTTLATIGIFVLLATILIILESFPNFPDADSFYHAKIATIIRDQGFIKTFPWFQWMIFKDSYIDPHLLYHILLIPFVTFFSPLAGMKVSAVVFGLLAYLVLYLSLRAFQAPWPWFFLLAAVLSQDLLFRISLPRAPSLSIAILLFGTWAMIKFRPWWLFVAAIIFGWLYHGWPVLLLSLLANFVAELITENICHQEKFFLILKKVIKKQNKIFFATLGGLLLSLIINPYFPKNLEFSLLDIFQIGVVNYQSILPVGQEWFPMEPLELFMGSIVIFSLFLLGLGCFLPALEKFKEKTSEKNFFASTKNLFTFLFLALGYLILTVKSKRFMEYALPFFTLSAGTIWVISRTFWEQEIYPFIQNQLKKVFIKIPVLVATLFIFISVLCGELFNLIDTDHDYFQTQQYQTAADWLKTNVPAGEVIFHNSWDFAPILWYLDDTHFYLAGLDPTFMYDYNPEAFDLWWSISKGENYMVGKIKTYFNSRVVIVDRRFDNAEKLIENLEFSGLFREVVKNQWVSVYADYSL